MDSPSLDWQKVDPILENALQEDIGKGDITTNVLFSPAQKARACILAKANGVIAGLPIIERVFQILDPTIIWELQIIEGQKVEEGELLVEIEGSLRTILSGERLSLNILQRLSGIATLTAACVKLVEGIPVKILDTRKTAPGLRLLDKYGVAVGGGLNHRFGLYDGIMIKDNHIKLAGGIGNAINKLKKANPAKLPIEVETSNLTEVQEALKAGADIIMLDNMSCENMTKAVQLIGRKALIEASGGVTLKSIRKIAQTGVNFISVGALTHSPRALDIGLYFYE